MTNKRGNKINRDALVKYLSKKLSFDDIIRFMVDHLQQEHNFTAKDILQMTSEGSLSIPSSVFSMKLSSLETITKYMRENLGMKNPKVAKALNRDIRTCWVTYNHAKKKNPAMLKPKKDDPYIIPFQEFTDRRLSVLEVIVSYLKDNYGLDYNMISALIRRKPSTVWTVYNRVLKKNG